MELLRKELVSVYQSDDYLFWRSEDSTLEMYDWSPAWYERNKVFIGEKEPDCTDPDRFCAKYLREGQIVAQSQAATWKEAEETLRLDLLVVLNQLTLLPLNCL